MEEPRRSSDKQTDGAGLDHRGAGRGGGWLFVVVLLFCAYLTLAAFTGLLRMIATVVLVAAAAALTANVIRRR